MAEWKKERAERRADFDKLAASVEGAGEASTGAPAGRKPERSHAQRLTFELLEESNSTRYSTLTINKPPANCPLHLGSVRHVLCDPDHPESELFGPAKEVAP